MKNYLIKKNNLINLCLFKSQVKTDEIPSYAKLANAMFLSLRKNDVFAKTIPAKLQSYLAMKKPVVGVLQGEGANIIKQSKQSKFSDLIKGRLYG